MPRYIPKDHVIRTRFVKKDNKWFTLPYKIVIAILAVVIIACWVIVYAKVAEYEKGSTSYLIGSKVDELSKEYGLELSYKRFKTNDDESIEYNIYSGDEVFAKTTLLKQDKQGMLGFNLYELGETKGGKSITFLAREEDKVLVGDMTKEDITASESGIVLPALVDLNNHKTNKTCKVPTYTMYTEDGLFDAPTVKLDGVETVYVNTGKGVLLAKKMSQGRITELKSYLSSFVDRYTKYVVFGKGFEDIKDDIFYTSPIYNIVAKFKWLWDYYYDYTIDMKEITYSDFIEYTDDIVSVRVRYEYNQTYKKNTTNNKPEINFYLYNDKGSWKVIEMQITEWK